MSSLPKILSDEREKPLHRHWSESGIRGKEPWLVFHKSTPLLSTRHAVFENTPRCFSQNSTPILSKVYAHVIVVCCETDTFLTPHPKISHYNALKIKRHSFLARFLPLELKSTPAAEKRRQSACNPENPLHEDRKGQDVMMFSIIPF